MSNKKNPWIRRIVLGLLGLGLVAMIVLASLPKPIPVQAFAASVEAMEVTIDEDARARVRERYVVSAPLAAHLMRIDLRPGDEVTQGQVIARMVPAAAPLLDARSRAQAQARLAATIAAQGRARAAIRQAETAAEFAGRDAERQRGLAARDMISRSTAEQAELMQRTRTEELAAARFASRVADHEAQLARVALGALGEGGEGEEEDHSFEIEAPIGGRVLRVLQSSEGVVQPGTPLLEIGDPSGLEVVVDVLTSDAVRVEHGQPVRLAGWGGEGELLGHVRRVEPAAFSQVSALGIEEQRVNVLVDFDSPRERWQSLGDGYRLEARIVVWSEDEVLQIPSSALFHHGEGWAVFTIEGGRARRHEIEIGRRNGVRVQILSGLEAGERVILHPGDNIEDGGEVEAQP